MALSDLQNNEVPVKTDILDLMPIGMIIMWCNPTIPKGWIICDGNNDTPNLVDRFPCGTNSSGNLKQTGGSGSVTLSTANLPSHNHSFSGSTLSSGSHSHSISCERSSKSGGSGEARMPGGSGYTALTNASGGHFHSFSGSTDYTGSGQAFSIWNPWCYVYFIMKVS